ncbi:MAG: hypothetical protein HOM58_04075 [Rhodospirillaceae bacterium]|jgi:hypothetical protein|nr:hypothetical protein [Rhodospirillaceae bacterium]
MSIFKSFWSVQGVSPEARDVAVRAAHADGEELGEWLSRLIHRVDADEMSAVASRQHAEQRTKSVSREVDDKLTSIERAMLRPDGGTGFTGNFGSA